MPINKSPYIKLLGVTAKFVHVFEPVSKFGSKPKYSAQFLIRDNDPQLAKLQQEIDKLSAEAFPGVKNVASPLRDGDTAKDTEKYPEYKGAFFIEPSTQFRPKVLDADRTELSPDDDDPFMDGDTTHAIIHLVTYEVGPKKGITSMLDVIQHWEHGNLSRGLSAMPELPCRSAEVDTVTETSSDATTCQGELQGW